MRGWCEGCTLRLLVLPWWWLTLCLAVGIVGKLHILSMQIDRSVSCCHLSYSSICKRLTILACTSHLLFPPSIYYQHLTVYPVSPTWSIHTIHVFFLCGLYHLEHALPYLATDKNLSQSAGCYTSPPMHAQTCDSIM